jgi:hypothetical protein
MRQFFVLGCLLALVIGSALQAETPKHSKVETAVTAEAGDLVLMFKVDPTSGNVINVEAPWKLDIKKSDGLKLTSTQLKQKDFLPAIPGFLLKAKPDKDAGELEYNLTAFVCSKNKENCFREVHAGKLPWKAK